MYRLAFVYRNYALETPSVKNFKLKILMRSLYASHAAGINTHLHARQIVLKRECTV